MAMGEQAFGTFVPKAGDTRWLAHLLRRTCFGVTVGRLEQFAKKSPGDVVDWLLGYDPEADPLNHLIEELDGFVTPFNKPEQLQGWWVYRMLKTSRPFQERIALFWHNRFATSVGKIENVRYMHQQIELFRRLGIGNYRELLIAVGRDPAMLLWLDGGQSKKGKPNENYARELMELFSLGIGNYTEQDVQEAARAFTGWTIRGNEGVLDPLRFDGEEKEVFGVRGAFNDEEVVDLILQKPIASRFLARKLLQEFVLPDPAPQVVEHYATRLLAHRWEIRPVLMEMLTSNLFYSDLAYRAKIKSPAELVIGAVQMMQEMGGKASVEVAVKSMAAMGQALLLPPSVKGWDGEQAWINANTMLVRMNYALGVTVQKGREFSRKSDVRGFLEKRDLTTAEAILDHFARVLLDGDLPAGVREKLLAFLRADAKGKPADFKFGSESVHTRVRPMMHMMMATVEYQLA